MTWSKHPPRQPGLFYFRGVRQTTTNQLMRFNEVVRVQHMQVGQRTSLGVAMLGKQRIYGINSYHGEWKPIEVEVADVR